MTGFTDSLFLKRDGIVIKEGAQVTFTSKFPFSFFFLLYVFFFGFIACYYV